MAAQILLGRVRSGIGGLLPWSELHIALLIEGKTVFIANSNSVDANGLQRNLPKILEILKQKGVKAVIEDGYRISWDMIDGFAVGGEATDRVACEELTSDLRVEAHKILAPILL